jgi:hypothetical protein
MVVRFRQHAGDHASLFGNPQAALLAERFDVDGLVHVLSKKEIAAPDISPVRRFCNRGR